MVKLFQYGSNMNKERLEDRIGEVQDIGKCVLSGYELVFDLWSNTNACAAANVRKNNNAFVIGRLYEVTEEQLAMLDSIEGKNYERKLFSTGVVTYVGKEGRVDKSAVKKSSQEMQEKYVRHILKGCREVSAGKEYMHSVYRVAGLSPVYEAQNVFDNPKEYLPDVLGISAHMRKLLGVCVGDLVEVEYGGRSTVLRVKKIPQELIEGEHTVENPITISRHARALLGLPKREERTTTKYSSMYAPLLVRKVVDV